MPSASSGCSGRARIDHPGPSTITGGLPLPTPTCPSSPRTTDLVTELSEPMEMSQLRRLWRSTNLMIGMRTPEPSTRTRLRARRPSTRRFAIL